MKMYGVRLKWRRVNLYLLVTKESRAGKVSSGAEEPISSCKRGREREWEREGEREGEREREGEGEREGEEGERE